MPDTPTKTSTSQRSLERLLARSVFQAHSLNLVLPQEDQIIYTPDALYNRFLQAHKDLKGHYSSGYGEYGKSVGLGISFNLSDLIFPGLSAVLSSSLNLDVNTEYLKRSLMLIHYNMPGRDPDFHSLKPVGFFKLSGKQTQANVKVNLHLASADLSAVEDLFKFSTFVLDDKQDYLSLALGLEMGISAQLDAQISRLRAPRPLFYVSSTADELKQKFAQDIGTVTLGDVVSEVKDWYTEILNILKACFAQKKIAYQESLTALDHVTAADEVVQKFITQNATSKSTISLIFSSVKSNLKAIPKKLKEPLVQEESPAIKIYNALSYFKVIDLYSTKVPTYAQLLTSARTLAQTIATNHPDLPEPIMPLIDLSKIHALIAAIDQVDLNQIDSQAATVAGFQEVQKIVGKAASAAALKTNLTTYFYSTLGSAFIIPKAARQSNTNYKRIQGSKEAIPEIIKLLENMDADPSLFSWTYDAVTSKLKTLFPSFNKTPLDESGLLDELRLAAPNQNGLPSDDVFGKISVYVKDSLKAKIVANLPGVSSVSESPLDNISFPDQKNPLDEIKEVIDAINIFFSNPYWKHAISVAGADYKQLQQGINWVQERVRQAQANSKTPQPTSPRPAAPPPDDPIICKLTATQFTLGTTAYVKGSQKAAIDNVIHTTSAFSPNSLVGTAEQGVNFDGLIHYNSFRYQNYGYLEKRAGERFIQSQDTLLKQKELRILATSLSSLKAQVSTKTPVSAELEKSIEKSLEGTYTQITYKAALSNWFENSPKQLEQGSGLTFGCSLEMGRLRETVASLKSPTQYPLSGKNAQLLKMLSRKLRVPEAQVKEALLALNEDEVPNKELWDTETVFIESTFAFDLTKLNPLLATDPKFTSVAKQDMLSLKAIKGYRKYLRELVLGGANTPTDPNNIGHLEAIHLRIILAKSADRSKTILGFTPRAQLLEASPQIKIGKVERAELESVVPLGTTFFKIEGQTIGEKFDHAVPPIAFVHQAHRFLNPIAAGSQDNAEQQSS